jgi:hypothetical protein
MATRLSLEDCQLLDELNRSGGTARISAGQSRMAPIDSWTLG